ncbi:MAG: POTRA domain-containing protein, partial [Myxococcota bacterium]
MRLSGVCALGLAVMAVPLAWGQDSDAGTQKMSESEEPAEDPSRPLISDETVLVVLPFEIHSARPLQHLVEALPSLLSARLETTGKIAVVEPSRVAELLSRTGGGELSDSEARRLAKQLDATGVVAASVTELAGGFSLDVRFTPADPTDRSRSVTYTAQGEKELIARLGQVSEQIVAALSQEDPDRIIGVRIVGSGSLEPKLRELLESTAGTNYDPDRVEADRERLEEQDRVAGVKVETERRAGGVVLVFNVVRSEAILAQSSSARSGEIVSAVRIRGNRRIESDAIRGRIRTREGDPLNRAKVAADVREIQALGFFQNVRVYTTQTPEGVRLTFEVEENPVIRQISITGNESLDTDKIEETMTLTTGSTLDYPLLHENDERITQLYKHEGYYLVEVTFSITPVKDGSVSVDFDIHEGKKLKLRNIEFVGNEAFSQKELQKKFQTKTWRWYSLATSWLDKTGTYSEPIFTRDLHEVETMYGDQGYLQVDIDEPEVDATEEGLFIRLKIKEGPQFHVGRIEVVGDSTMDLDALREKVRLNDGDVFSRSYLT